ncbi:MAG: hypothetical protein EBR30_16440 [Cytophagia bacterium]|jgi:hypothetical protein|nr:hypothetical protein [Cytophagia bacterium]
MKQLYQYAAIFHKYDFNEEGIKVYKDSELVIEPKYVLANDEKEVIFKATKHIGEYYANSPDSIEIVIKKF